jgi:hypothetical protein
MDTGTEPLTTTGHGIICRRHVFLLSLIVITIIITDIIRFLLDTASSLTAILGITGVNGTEDTTDGKTGKAAITDMKGKVMKAGEIGKVITGLRQDMADKS